MTVSGAEKGDCAMTSSNTIPAWFRDHAVYQINPRTFSAEGVTIIWQI